MNIPTAVVDTVAVKAAAFDAIDGKRRDSLQRRLYLSLIRAHAEGVVSLTTKELREWHASKSGEWKEVNSLTGPINALVLSGLVEYLKPRRCSVTGQTACPLRAVAQQGRLV